MKKQFCFIVALIVFPLLMFAASTETFQQGKQYKQISVAITSPVKLDAPQGKVTVTEFFSYGCPWCFRLEPALEQWLKTKPDYVEFQRIPVAFESGWDVYSKAYYAAEALGITNKITPALFDAIHKQHQNLASDSAIEKFFISQGVKKEDFDNAYNFSPSMSVEMQRANALMLAYKIYEIPSIIINGKYVVTPVLNDGDDKQVIQVVDYLVKKEKSGAK